MLAVGLAMEMGYLRHQKRPQQTAAKIQLEENTLLLGYGFLGSGL
jgi:hypothetical protein